MEKCTNYVEPIIKLGERFSEKFTEAVEIFNKLCSCKTEEERDQYIETLPQEIKNYLKQETPPVPQEVKNHFKQEEKEEIQEKEEDHLVNSFPLEEEKHLTIEEELQKLRSAIEILRDYVYLGSYGAGDLGSCYAMFACTERRFLSKADYDLLVEVLDNEDY